ncbi:MAG: methionine--tRNA ligase [Candidatus Komeilibacteria bacterium RIFCSPLOWO2_01_FULL_45_10]|uniref:methionine--tRNA ligase n=1 Tax=Candidatus Komeilibacteria bacterium RIFCSPLOWO2_01_FULL_45_10 TaxID=1798550 RepID=A0A1G2BI17_9BACT|nr:MAG: methionine--tRNA ligase [Candidatus Komeilibacteria bacterium RIFCSPLOWO2_01_FULL_45_10]
MKKFYITTAIPYVNARPHIGFALEAVQADVLARYRRELGEEVFFLTGTDENSLKNVQAAEKEGIGPQMFCDRNAKIFYDLKKALNLSFDEFIRTTEKRHFLGAQKLWSACRQEDIYKKKYKGLYCVGCETFYEEKELIQGKCPEHQTAPEVIEEENYFFKLSRYQEKLFKLIESDEYKIIPSTRKNEVLSFIKMGLKDFSISRSKERAHGWGVPVPGDESQIMYVWFDALANYLTALDYNKEGKLYKNYWPADVHVIGKGVIRFHAVYWPAMLLSAGLPLPKELFVHGYITSGGEKMSKSLGNVINPFQLVEKYGADAVRYFLLKYVHPFEDSDFTIEKFEEVYNADLANGLGNLVSRTANLIEKNFDDKIDIGNDREFNLEEVDKSIEDYQFNVAFQIINHSISLLDAYIDEEKPWELIKKDKDQAKRVLSRLTDRILIIAKKLKPFLPQTAEKILKQFTARKIKKGESLFPRI